MDLDRWTLRVVFDSTETQTRMDPSSRFPLDEASQFMAFIGKTSGALPEELSVFVEWSLGEVTVQSPGLGFINSCFSWLCMHTVPQSMFVTRNEERG